MKFLLYAVFLPFRAGLVWQNVTVWFVVVNFTVVACCQQYDTHLSCYRWPITGLLVWRECPDYVFSPVPIFSCSGSLLKWWTDLPRTSKLMFFSESLCFFLFNLEFMFRYLLSCPFFKETYPPSHHPTWWYPEYRTERSVLSAAIDCLC